VALKSIGSPIAGDIRYAAVEDAKKEERAYLHAFALVFTLNKEKYAFVCEPTQGERFRSESYKNQLELWSSPWDFFKK